MKVNGIKDKKRELEYFILLMEIDMKENGKMILNMV